MLKGFTNFLQNFFFDFDKASSNARASRKCVPAAAKFLANRADIDLFIFRTHAHAHFAVSEFFKKYGDNDAANCPEMVDQTFVVFRKNCQICGSF